MKIFWKWRFLAAAPLAAAALAGCGGNDNGTVTPPAPDTIDFRIFTNQAFSNSANSTPVSLNLTFNFDANDDPTAFDTLLAAGSFGGS